MALSQYLDHIYLSQFWSVIGLPSYDITPLGNTISSILHPTQLSLSFCHFLSDQTLSDLLKHLHPSARESIRSIDLYFCYKITNATVLHLLKLFPNTQKLNLGSCFFLTDSCISSVMRFGKQLQHLNLSTNKRFTSEILLELGTHPTLKQVNLEDTNVLQEAVQEQALATPHLTILGPGRALYAKAYQPARKQDEG